MAPRSEAIDSNIDVMPDRTGHLHGLSIEAAVRPGPQSLLDKNGAALIVHSGADDNVVNRRATRGAHIACGVLAAAENSGATLHPDAVGDHAVAAIDENF